jgi:hypothetical protein
MAATICKSKTAPPVTVRRRSSSSNTATVRTGLGGTWRKASMPEIAATASAEDRGIGTRREFVTTE